MNRLSWEETEAIREALFHSRMDHQSKSPPHTAAMQRVEAAEKELAGLLGVSVPFSYSPEGTGE